MLIREAIRLLASARWSQTRKVVLVCAFEPLHLETYLQALLVARYPEESPRLIRFGYDQLREGLARTATEFMAYPVLLYLSWEDLHPGLSWRSRTPFGEIKAEEIVQQGHRLKGQLNDWMKQRVGAETYVALPPLDWLPLHDAAPTSALGPTVLVAQAILQDVVQSVAVLGGRVLRLPTLELNYRELLQSGCPLSMEDSERVAQHFVDTAYRSTIRKKAIVTDLDGTLWCGVIGETGPEGIHCRPDGKGYPYYVFQKFLAKLKREGIWLAFCSKNNPEDVLPVFDALEMPLRFGDFAAYRCNWEPKPDNITSIAEELNISWEDMIVVDDNPAELAGIRFHLPRLATFQTPREGLEWKRLMGTLQELCGTWRVSDEDRLRTANTSVLRRHAEKPADSTVSSQYGAPDQLDYLKDLQLHITVNRGAFSDPRSLELINKTNQFNLTGERISTEEWLQWADVSGAFCISAQLRDRFGDFGTICVMTGRVQDDAMVWIRQLVLSCRAFGRGVETVILGDLLSHSEWEWLTGTYKRTGKNEPAERFLTGFGCPVELNGEWRISRQAVEAAAANILRETAAHVYIASAETVQSLETQQAGSALRKGG